MAMQMHLSKEIQETPEHLHLQLAERYVAAYLQENPDSMYPLQRTLHFRNDTTTNRIVYSDMKDVEVLCLRKFRAKFFDVLQHSGKEVVCASIDESNARRMDRITDRFVSGMQNIMLEEKARAREAEMAQRVLEESDRQKSERIMELEMTVRLLQEENSKKGAAGFCDASGKTEAEHIMELEMTVRLLQEENSKKSAALAAAERVAGEVLGVAQQAAEFCDALGKTEAEWAKEVQVAMELLSAESRKKSRAMHEAKNMLGNVIQLADEAVDCCSVYASNEAWGYETAVELLAVENAEKSSALRAAEGLVGELVVLAQEAADCCEALAAKEADSQAGKARATPTPIGLMPDIHVENQIAALCNELENVSTELSLQVPDLKASYENYQKQRHKIATLLRESYSKNKLLQTENRHLVKLKDGMLQNQRRFTDTMLNLEAQCRLEQYHARMRMAQQCNKWLQRRPAMQQAVVRFVFGEWLAQAQDQDNFSQRRHRLHTMQRHDTMLQRHPNVGRVVRRVVFSLWHNSVGVCQDKDFDPNWARVARRRFLNAWRNVVYLTHKMRMRMTRSRAAFGGWARIVLASRARRWKKLHRAEAVLALEEKRQTGLMRAAFAELYDAYVCLGRDVAWESMQV